MEVRVKPVFTSFVLLLTLGSSAFCSTTDFGNGGNIVLCSANHGLTSAYFYDVYEANARYGLAPFFPASGKCSLIESTDACKFEAQKEASLLASRLKKNDRAFEEEIQILIRKFWDESRLVNADLFSINDSGMGFIPADCSLKQLAIQHIPLNKNDKRYFISLNLLKLLDVQNQAAMILHEVLYRWALTQNPNIAYSERIRYFNGLVLSDKVAQMSYLEYVQEKASLVSDQ